MHRLIRRIALWSLHRALSHAELWDALVNVFQSPAQEVVALDAMGKVVHPVAKKLAQHWSSLAGTVRQTPVDSKATRVFLFFFLSAFFSGRRKSKLVQQSSTECNKNKKKARLLCRVVTCELIAIKIGTAAPTVAEISEADAQGVLDELPDLRDRSGVNR